MTILHLTHKGLDEEPDVSEAEADEPRPRPRGRAKPKKNFSLSPETYEALAYIQGEMTESFPAAKRMHTRTFSMEVAVAFARQQLAKKELSVHDLVKLPPGGK